jgi:hypothetical protein
MNDTPTPVEAEKKAEKAMLFSDFLENTPPGAAVNIVDVMKEEQGHSRKFWRLNVPRLTLDCEQCGGPRYFRYEDGDRSLPDNKTEYSTFINYICSNCRKSRKRFSLWISGENEVAEGKAYKYGELPPFGPITPPRLLKMLGANRDLFMRGRRCESQGLGIGAFVYYRRVVEEQRTSIIGEIIRVARLIKTPTTTIDLLEAAQNETQFSKSLNLIKHAIPESLLVQGHNPMTLLHDNLSSGLHAKTDEDCLETAQAVRIVLAELAERLTSALKDESTLTKALDKLLNKTQPRVAKE